MGLTADKFDVLGFFELSDNRHIEPLTTPLSDGTFLSRSMVYYTLKTCRECSELREWCKFVLQNYDLNQEKKFVLYENMLNCSAKVFYKELQKKISNQPNDYQNAKNCVEEDCYNLIQVMKGEETKNSNLVLTSSDDVVEERQIELDNKALIALFCSELDVNDNVNIILTGLGGLYLGPFCKIIHGCDYAVAPLSAYAGAKDLLNNDSLELRKYLSEPSVLEDNKEIVFLDDNIGTGNTMKSLTRLIENEGKSCRCGAVQYNWINYHKVEIGEKSIDRFNPNEIDFLTKFNYPGIKLLNHAVFDHLSNSGDDYVDYIKSKSYRHKDESDIVTLWLRGERYANESGVFFQVGGKEHMDDCKKIKQHAYDFILKLEKMMQKTK